MHDTHSGSVTRRYAWLLTVSGAVGLFCSFVLTLDKMHLLQNPSADVGCNINPIISCGSVMRTPEASLPGFANSLLGLPAFAVVLLIGVALLAGSRFGRLIWYGLLAGAFGGILLTHYLFVASVYHIGALCPYCMVIWVVTMLVFWYTLQFCLRGGLIRLPQRVSRFMTHHHLDLFVLWIVMLFGLILNHFWYYFGCGL